MKYFWSNIVIYIVSGVLVTSAAPATADLQLSRHQTQYERSLHQRFGGHCNASNIAVRKNWEYLTNSERKSYTNAVKCLRSKPAVTSRSVAPGVFNRMDDFTYQHITQTPYIHFSGWLLPWHRYFVHQYEKALRDECGYDGYQPYWDWTMHESNLTAMMIFDGSENSLGGNGQYKPHGYDESGDLPGIPTWQYVNRPPGTGGGCVTDGPWDNNFTVTLGPIFPNTSAVQSESEWFSSNPRCLSRDFLQALSSAELTTANVNALLAAPSLSAFRPLLDAHVHFGGHASVGGDLIDIYSSPNDPAFYFHHAQIDRIWTLWQNQDPVERVYATSDTITYNNSPPSGNATLGDLLAFGPVGGDVRMFELVDTIRGRFCYRYE